jgi:hypothetical protein
MKTAMILSQQCFQAIVVIVVEILFPDFCEIEGDCASYLE